MVERNMCNAVMRGIVVPPGSRATSRAKGSRWNLGYRASKAKALNLRQLSGELWKFDHRRALAGRDANDPKPTLTVQFGCQSKHDLIQ